MQRRRRWSTGEKVRIVEETYLPGNSVSLVARHHGIAGNQLFSCMMSGFVPQSETYGAKLIPERVHHLRGAGGLCLRARPPGSSVRP